MNDFTDPLEMWTEGFKRAMVGSHHHSWPQDFINEAAAICADVVMHTMEYVVNAGQEVGEKNSTPPPERETQHGGYM